MMFIRKTCFSLALVYWRVKFITTPCLLCGLHDQRDTRTSIVPFKEYILARVQDPMMLDTDPLTYAAHMQSTLADSIVVPAAADISKCDKRLRFYVQRRRADFFGTSLAFSKVTGQLMTCYTRCSVFCLCRE